MASVLIIGNGGREHALAWRMAKSESVKKVWIAPGNGADFEKPEIDTTNADEVVDFCQRENVSLIVVGPEGPLADGFVDRIDGRVPVFGPTRAGAQLEASKIYSKTFMKKNGLPTAEFASFSDIANAEAFIERCEWRGIVVKADGLAAGKGVVVADSKEGAKLAAQQFLAGQYGESSSRILLEERLYGYEVSALCFTDGTSIARMPLVRDHKRLLENDMGPNTGGMGVVAPVSLPESVDREIDRILKNTVASLRKDGIIYKGVIYAGLIVTANGPQLLEYNCRFGDPEIEVIMRLLKSDLFSICMATVNGSLSQLDIQWDDRYACGIVLASKNYPYSSDKGTPIDFAGESEDAVVFHAGTKKSKDGRVETNGGRILCVTVLGQSPSEARLEAIRASDAIHFEGKFFRRDIGLGKQSSVNSLTYEDSGVNISEGNAFVNDIKGLVKTTLREGTEQIGGFGAVIDLKKAGFRNGAELVIGIDGVGTKIEIADALRDYSDIGYDVVGMCVNDVLCHCAAPIAFVDYYVSGRLNREQARKVVASIAKACVECDCSLVGGETAEMPGVYGAAQWDLAGCAVAVRDPHWPKLPASESICVGDVLIGLPSSGLHSNGFSLVRKIFKMNEIQYNDKTPWNSEQTFGQILLTPTRLYVTSVLPLLKEGLVKGCAHITGGGIAENLPRVLSSGSNLAMEVDVASWKKPDIFNWLAGMGPVEPDMMFRTFNCGIGMVLVVPTQKADAVLQRLTEKGDGAVRIGSVVERRGTSPIIFMNLSTAFTCQYLQPPKPKIKVGILISGNGSNMVKLIESSRKPFSYCEVRIVISNKSEARGMSIAKAMGIETLHIPHTQIREVGDSKISEALRAREIQLICLAGYMRVLSPKFVEEWRGRIINIHPSILPSFKGQHAVRDAISFGAKIAGCTAHFVDEVVDHGAIIAQESVKIEEGDDEEKLHERIQEKEHQVFPDAMQRVAKMLLKSTHAYANGIGKCHN
uniref:Trifunctional purine biosynthetic protein adenosine-3 n=1 Tax=Haemonchus contortus TaxID=6289 RepID=A0A7I4YK16_HAECO